MDEKIPSSSSDSSTISKRKKNRRDMFKFQMEIKMFLSYRKYDPLFNNR